MPDTTHEPDLADNLIAAIRAVPPKPNQRAEERDAECAALLRRELRPIVKDIYWDGAGAVCKHDPSMAVGVAELYEVSDSAKLLREDD